MDRLRWMRHIFNCPQNACIVVRYSPSQVVIGRLVEVGNRTTWRKGSNVSWVELNHRVHEIVLEHWLEVIIFMAQSLGGIHALEIFSVLYSPFALWSFFDFSFPDVVYCEVATKTGAFRFKVSSLTNWTISKNSSFYLILTPSRMEFNKRLAQRNEKTYRKLRSHVFVVGVRKTRQLTGSRQLKIW